MWKCHALFQQVHDDQGSFQTAVYGIVVFEVGAYSFPPVPSDW